MPKQSHLRGMPEPVTLNWPPTDTLQTLAGGGGHLLEMIAKGTPLEGILDKLCASLDAQIGRATSLVYCWRTVRKARPLSHV
jgi:hypothetical protein